MSETGLQAMNAVRCEQVSGKLNQRQSVSLVKRSLAFSSRFIRSRALDAPNLDVPTVGKEVGAVPPIARQTRFVDVRNVVGGQPIIDAHFVGGSDLVPVSADVAISAVESIVSDGNIEGFSKTSDQAFANPMLHRNCSEGQSLIEIKRAKSGFIWKYRVSTASALSPALRLLDPHISNPSTSHRLGNAETTSNLIMWQVLRMDQVHQLFASRWGKSTIGEAPTRRANGNPVLIKPTTNRDMGNAEPGTYRTRRQSLINVQRFKHVFGRAAALFHASSIPRSSCQYFGTVGVD